MILFMMTQRLMMMVLMMHVGWVLSLRAGACRHCNQCNHTAIQ